MGALEATGTVFSATLVRLLQSALKTLKMYFLLPSFFKYKGKTKNYTQGYFYGGNFDDTQCQFTENWKTVSEAAASIMTKLSKVNKNDIYKTEYALFINLKTLIHLKEYST